MPDIIRAQYNLPEDEAEWHRDRAMYRINRKNRLRYRKPGLSNWKKPKGWLHPTLRNKADQHVFVDEKRYGMQYR